MNSLEKFAEYLIQNAESISREIVNYSLKNVKIELPAELIESSISTNRDFLEFAGKTLNLTDEIVKQDFIQWFKQKQEESQVQMQSHPSVFEKLSSIIEPYAENRRRLIRMLGNISMEQGLTVEEIIFVTERINYLLDLSMTHTFIEREQLAIETNKKNQRVIMELSSPVVPLQDGIAVLPLVGEIGLDRSDYILNNVIPKISQLNIECLIIDFSALVKIDTEIADRIFNIYHVLALLGINTIFTGIRPDLATTVVNAKINFPSLKTFATVKQALLNNI
ncbi:STAS domain-containing protein [Bacillus infantis]|uniref:STAS domain-containing protein n=1 Tax=Bacillus infantis TaxID=324767 RepID=A0A5D4RNY5_9BACI|nr:STAS domain-containing protein [Bacillus infantis]TYS51202.1 STAS domain-containing protein [Bacillus infantis]